MTIDEMIADALTPQSFNWWGTDFVDVVPALVDKPLGDGMWLMTFSSMDCRPYHWLIRVDSSVREMNRDQVRDYVERVVIDAIVDCFGECTCDEDNEQSCDCRFPTLILETGYSWSVYGKEDYDDEG